MNPLHASRRALIILAGAVTLAGAAALACVTTPNSVPIWLSLEPVAPGETSIGEIGISANAVGTICLSYSDTSDLQSYPLQINVDGNTAFFAVRVKSTASTPQSIEVTATVNGEDVSDWLEI